MYIMDHTFGYHSKKLTCACAESSVHAHGSEIRDLKLFKTTVGCIGLGRWAPDLQVSKQTQAVIQG